MDQANIICIKKVPTEARLRKGELQSSIKSKTICSFLNNHSFSTALYRGLIPPVYFTKPLTSSSVLDIRLALFLNFEMEHLSGDTENQNTSKDAHTYCCQNDKSV